MLNNLKDNLLRLLVVALFVFVVLTYPVLLLVPVAAFAIGIVLELIGIDVGSIPLVGTVYDFLGRFWEFIVPEA